MTKDIVRNYQSYCKTQAKNNNPTAEFTKSLKELLSNNVPDLQFVQNVQSGNIAISAAQLKKVLRKKLPSAYVRVLPIPVNVMDRLYFVV